MSDKEKRILHMVAPNDPRLLSKIAPYNDDMLKEHGFKDRKELGTAMYDTMKKYGGIGLSCNQVGLPFIRYEQRDGNDERRLFIFSFYLCCNQKT